MFLHSLCICSSLSLCNFHSIRILTCALTIWWIKMPCIESEKISNVYEPTGWRNGKFSKITNYARITFIFYILIWNVVCSIFMDLLSFFYCKTEQLQTEHFSMNPASGAFTRAQYFYCIIIHTLLGYSLLLFFSRSILFFIYSSSAPSSHASSLCKCFSIRANSFLPWSSIYIYFFSSRFSLPEDNA